MAPTEILAEQHFRTVMKWLDGTSYRVRLLTGRVTAAKRKALLPAIERGEIDMVIGTHALVQEHVAFRDLALVDHRRAAPIRRHPARARWPARAAIPTCW